MLVFPSRTDAFGPVVLGALAGGVPVAALPATGPRDVIGDALNDDLGKAWLVTLILSRKPLPCACGSR